MKRIIQLLNDKNHFLERFCSLNESELAKFAYGNYDEVDLFYHNRERILELISYIDEEIVKAQDALGEGPVVNAEDRRLMKMAWAIKDQYVEKIIEQDIEILSCIEAARTSVMQELQEVRHGRKAVAGYKSPSFKSNLDEEA